ncbi:MAG: 1-acyl-sn-glycerol-3-phosphate acyltransferase [Tetrasphaera sp.]
MALTSVRPPPVIVRRLLRLVWPSVAILTTILGLPVLVAGAVASLVDRRARLFRATGLTLLVVWLDVQLLSGCWRLRLADPRGSGPTWKADHEQLLADVLDTAMRVGKKWVGFEVRLDTVMDFGDPERPLLAFARHAGPADSLAVAWLLSRTAGRLPRIVLADALRWDPGIDLILTRLGSDFVPSLSGAGDDRLSGVRRLADSLGRDDALLMFPEGQNFSPSRRSRLIARLRERGQAARVKQAERLRNVLPPKTKGVIATLQARPDADVMIVAHAGLGRLTGVRDIYAAIPFEHPFLVHTWTYAAESVPRDPAAIEAWLAQRWTEIDTWVEGRD